MKKYQAPGEASSPDPATAFRDMYQQMWKQAEGQWDQVLRHPQFLAAMAAGFEQSLNLMARVQQAVTTTLGVMNIPTGDDLQALTRSLEALREEVAVMSRKLDRLSAAPPAKKARPAGNVTGRGRRGEREKGRRGEEAKGRK